MGQGVLGGWGGGGCLGAVGGAHPGWPCCGGWPRGLSSSTCASPPPSCRYVPGSGPTGSPCVTSHWIWFLPSRSICSVTGCALLNSSSHQVPSVGTHEYPVDLRGPYYQARQSCRAQSAAQFSAEEVLDPRGPGGGRQLQPYPTLVRALTLK